MQDPKQDQYLDQEQTKIQILKNHLGSTTLATGTFR